INIKSDSTCHTQPHSCSQGCSLFESLYNVACENLSCFLQISIADRDKGALVAVLRWSYLAAEGPRSKSTTTTTTTQSTMHEDMSFSVSTVTARALVLTVILRAVVVIYRLHFHPLCRVP